MSAQRDGVLAAMDAAVGRSFVNVAGTEFWIRVSRAEVKELARAGYTVVPDVVNGDTYWSAKEASS